MIEYWLRTDAAIRTVIVGALYRVTTPQKVIRVCAAMDVLRYRGWDRDRRARMFLWCVRLSAKLYRNPCLIHATVFYWMDRESKLAIGIKAGDVSAEAHAWVECSDEVLSTVSTENYTRLFSMDGSP